MAVTEYIGPLVGPVFADPAEWTPTRSYEALTIVLNEGNSYTARQDVPIGVQITNEDYWLETGNYNAQVEQYRQEVKTLDSRVTANSQAIETNSQAIEKDIKLAYDKVYDSVVSMKSDTSLKNGMKCKTLGYYTANDYGGAAYIITDTDEPNELDIISCANNLNAKLIIQDNVNVNCLGAKGNGEKDAESRMKNVKAFERAFSIGKSIVCMPNGRYWFNQNGPVNCRFVTDSFTLDGNNSTFSDFSIELNLKDDSYDWRFAFNWNTGKFININFGGADYYTIDSTPYRPCIVSGMAVDIQHVNMINKCVLLAYVNRYMDDLSVYDLRTVFGVELPDMNKHNLIESIDINGTLSKSITNDGDGWSFTSVSEVHSTIDSDPNGELYGLVSTHAQKSISFNNCIQIFVEIGSGTCASFKDCHFELPASGVRYINNNSGFYLLCTFIDCYFWGSAFFPVDIKTTYIGCVFCLQFGYNHTQSLFKTAKLISCRIEDTYTVSSSKDLTTSDMASNYNTIWNWFSTSFDYWENKSFPDMGFTGDTSIAAYIRLLDSDVYYKKLTDTQSFKVPTNITFHLASMGSCIIDLYVTNSGKVYHTQNIVTDLANTVYIKMTKYSVIAGIEQRDMIHHKASIYPTIDTPEIVESIPEYTERQTAYLIAPNLFVDTTVTDWVKGYTRIDKTQLNQGGF